MVTGQQELQCHGEKVSSYRAKACTSTKQDLIKKKTTAMLCPPVVAEPRFTLGAVQELCFNTAEPTPSARVHPGVTPFTTDNSKQNPGWF